MWNKRSGYLLIMWWVLKIFTSREDFLLGLCAHKRHSITKTGRATLQPVARAQPEPAALGTRWQRKKTAPPSPPAPAGREGQGLFQQLTLYSQSVLLADGNLHVPYAFVLFYSQGT